jgi:hypothetical protein
MRSPTAIGPSKSVCTPAETFTATPSLASAFMTTTDQSFAAGVHVVCWVPGPDDDAVQKIWSAGEAGGELPGTFR